MGAARPMQEVSREEREEYYREREIERLMRAPGQVRGEASRDRRTTTLTRRGVKSNWRPAEAD